MDSFCNARRAVSSSRIRKPDRHPAVYPRNTHAMKPYVLTLLAIIGLTSVGIFLVARKSVVPKSAPAMLAPSPGITPPPAPPAPLSPAASAPIQEHVRPAPAATTTPAVEESPPPETRLVDEAIMRKNAAAATKAAASGRGVSDAETVAAIKADIQALVATRNPGNVPAVARWLEHGDEGVRQQAVLGLLGLGEKSGAPFLMAATVKARTPEEAELFKEAAELLNKGVENAGSPSPSPETPPPPTPVDVR